AASAVVAYRSEMASSLVTHLEPGTWIVSVLQGLWYHVQKELMPVRLSPLLEFKADITFSDPTTIVSGAGVLAVTVALLGLRRRWPAGLAAWIWYVIALAPFMTLAHAGRQITADRYSYLACWGWALALGGGMGASVRAASRARAGRHALAAGGTIVLLALAFLANQPARVLEDPGPPLLPPTPGAPHL